MASPWKFLVRLVSSQRQQSQGDKPLEGEKLQDLLGAGPAETSIDETINPTDQPIADTPPALPSTPAPEEPEPLEEPDAGMKGVAEGNGASDPALEASGIGGPVVLSKPEAPVKSAPAKRRGRIRDNGAIGGVEPTAAVSGKSDESSLDDEIKNLRGQLAQKLRQQNAKLKTMLERFDR